MGKTQSKRSVDITTDATKKGPDEGEVTGKLEKIEDLDQKQVNGDATPQESNDADKKDADESENDKDLTTEKSGGEVAQASGDEAGGDQSTAAAGAESPKEDSAASGEAKEGAAVEEISPLSDDSAKKSKKEKVKKKWSFRSISFGKKDKQKPAKTEETETTAVATNGEGDKAIAEGIIEATSNKDEVATAAATTAGGDAAEAKPAVAVAEKHENGEATEEELNGQKTTTPTEGEKEQLAEVVAATETTAAVAAATTNTTNTTTTEKFVIAAATISNDGDETATNENNETEKKAAVAAAAAVETIVEAAAAAVTLSNGEEKNVFPEVAAEAAVENNKEVTVAVTIKVAPSDEVPIETASIPSVVVDEQPHHNGTDATTASASNGDNDEPQKHEAEIIAAAAAAELPINKSSQIEVKTNTDNTPPTSCSSSTPPPPLNASNIASNSSYSTTTNTTSDYLPSPIIPNNEDSQELLSGGTSNEAATKTTVQVLEKIIAQEAEEEEHCLSSKNDEVGAFSDSQQVPPPLPISPPPSQVSVFAFKNQAEEEEDASAAIADDDVENREVQQDQQQQCVESAFSETKATEGEEKAVQVADKKTEQIPDSLVTTLEIENMAVEIVTFDSGRISPTFAEVVVPVQFELATQAQEEDLKIDAPSASSLDALLKELNNEPEFEEFVLVGNDEKEKDITKNATELTIAAAVVDEVTIKAIEIIEQQEERKKEQTTEEKEQREEKLQLPPPQEQETLEEVQAEDRVDEQTNQVNVAVNLTEIASSKQVIDAAAFDDDEDKSKVSYTDEIEDTHLPAATVTPPPTPAHDNIELTAAAPIFIRAVDECDNFNEIISQIENQNNVEADEEDCLLQFEKLSLTTEVVVLPSTSASDIDSAAADKQLLSHNLLNSASKETVDVAKDLKENAAAEITQDLPVTCE